MSMSGMCEKCRIGIGRENRNRVRMETTGMFPVWDQVIEKRSEGSHCGGVEECRESDPPQAENPANRILSCHRKTAAAVQVKRL